MLKRIFYIILILSFCFRVTNAEVMDKLSSNEENIAFGIIFSFLLLFLARYAPWFLIIAIPITALFILASIGDINDKFLGPAILKEAGQGYVDNVYRINLLLAFSLFSGIIWRIYYKKHNKNA